MCVFSIQPIDFIQISPAVPLLFCIRNFSGLRFNPRSPVTFQLSCPFSRPSSGSVLVFLRLLNFDILRSRASHFVDCPLVWVCPLLHQIQGMLRWQEYPRSEPEFLSLILSCGRWLWLIPTLVTLTLITKSWTRPPSFPTAKSLFSPL